MTQPSCITGNGRTREGRALVECLVAALLLSVTTLALAATARGTLALSDDAQLITRAQALATTRVENAVGNGCALGASGNDAVPRVALFWQQSGAATTSQLHMDLTLDRTPIAFNAATPMQFAIEGGIVCP
jgi:Tfp pilus assembly protein PilV